MDAGTGLTILGGALGSAKLLEKLLGPTADYLGTSIKDFAEKRMQNLSRIFQKSADILGTRLDEPGTVPPTVLKELLSSGTFCEDELTASYFAGVLAASRSETIRDDRGKVMASLVARLATYEVRAHYIIYTLFRTAYLGHVDCALEETMNGMGLHIPGSVFDRAMEFNPDEQWRAHTLAGAAVQGLYRERLIHNNWSFISDKSDECINYELVVRPEICGYALFLWAHGKSDVDVADFTNPDIDIPVGTKISIPHGYKVVR